MSARNVTPGGVRDRRGFVLIAALWLLVALGAVGLNAGLQMRTERLAAANSLDRARAREAAFAGAEYARSRLTAALLDRAEELRAQAASANRGRNQGRVQSVQRLFRNADPLEDPWRDPGGLVVSEMIFGDARFTLRLRDAQSVLNINAADEEMLLSFFSQGLALDFGLAERITQAIADWRDPDDLPRPGGGEREEYLRAGAPVLPPNRGFADMDELRHVMGMTPEIFAAVLPYITLRGSGDINVNAAPYPVLLAIPGMTPEAATELLRLREAGEFPTSRQQLFRMLPEALTQQMDARGRSFENRVTFRTDQVEIISEGRVEGSPVSSRVRLTVVRSDQGALVVTRVFD